jgi:hypothetical protein
MTCLRPGALCKWSGRLQTAGRKGFSYGDYLSRRRGETGRLQKAAIEAKQVSDEKLHRGAPDEADDGHAIVTEIAEINVAILPTRLRALRPEKVVELAESMKVNGLLQPIVVRDAAEKFGCGYILVAGWHRLAAAHRGQWRRCQRLRR